MKNEKWLYIIGLATVTISHLLIAPLLAAYGVSACPVFQEIGFLKSCFISIWYAGLALGLDLIFLAIIGFTLRKSPKAKAWLLGGHLSFGLPLASVLVHQSIFFFVSKKLGDHIIDMGSLVGPQLQAVVFLSSILISVFQAKWIETIVVRWLRINVTSLRTVSENQKDSFFWVWSKNQLRQLLPFFSAVVFFGYFLRLVFYRIQEQETVNRDFLQERWMDLYFAASAVGIWYLLIQLLEFSKDQLIVRSIEQQIDALARQKGDQKRSAVASGGWSFVIKALNQASDLIVQKSRLVRGFSAYVSGSLVEHVIHQESLERDGELRELTILCADLRDFTSWSSQLTPKQVVYVLNLYFSEMIDVFSERGVVLDKFIGDGILAYVEAQDLSVEEELHRAVQVAIEMHHRLARVNQRLKSEGLPLLRLGVGVHRGAVVLGSIGAQSRMQYTIIGDPVNVCARLEGFCKELHAGVVISAVVFQSLSQDVQDMIENFGRHRIRGVQDPMELYGLTHSGIEKLSDSQVDVSNFAHFKKTS